LSISKDKFQRAQRAFKSEFDSFKEYLEAQFEPHFTFKRKFWNPIQFFPLYFAVLKLEKNFVFKKNAPGAKILKKFLFKRAPKKEKKNLGKKN
jgi:hypothetical protein